MRLVLKNGYVWPEDGGTPEYCEDVELTGVDQFEWADELYIRFHSWLHAQDTADTYGWEHLGRGTVRVETTADGGWDEGCPAIVVGDREYSSYILLSGE